MKAFRDGLTTLIPAESISERVAELGRQINADYPAEESLVLLVVLKGSFIFAADLARAIERKVRIEFLGVQSYGDETHSSGAVQITQDLTKPITGEHVLVIEDIVDTGLTLSYLVEVLAARHPKSLKVCTLLHKPSRQQRQVTIDYLGFTVEDVFVVGYGLDHAQYYRNLAEIAVVTG